eukprot:4050314-Prymnesium_polylepis.2
MKARAPPAASASEQRTRLQRFRIDPGRNTARTWRPSGDSIGQRRAGRESKPGRGEHVPAPCPEIAPPQTLKDADAMATRVVRSKGFGAPGLGAFARSPVKWDFHKCPLSKRQKRRKRHYEEKTAAHVAVTWIWTRGHA